MKLALAFCQSDVQSAISLLEWMKRLGGTQSHKIMLVADADTGWEQCVRAMEIAESCFESASLIASERSVKGWPEGANALFFTALRCVTDEFLWLEPDATPLKSDWINQIESAYSRCPGKFMGHMYDSTTQGMPKRLMSGIAVYPANAINRLEQSYASAWDVYNAEVMVLDGVNSPLVRHFWGQPNLAPTFAESKMAGSPVNTFTLESIPPNVVLFHRCKDGSLMRLLKKKLFPNEFSPLLAVLPFCGKDVEAALRNVQWMAELGGVSNYEALLIYDEQTKRTYVQEIQKAAGRAFGKVTSHSYRVSGNNGWPRGANIALQTTARYVESKYRIPWLWIESDAVPVRSSWLDELFAAYRKCCKSFFGPIVPDRGHQNGVMIYPWNMASRCPIAMAATSLAWDYVGTPDMINDRANAEPLIRHIWGLHNGQPHPWDGHPIRFSSIEDVDRWIPKESVLVHRVKFNDLIQLLRKRRT